MEKKESDDCQQYHTTAMQKELVLQKLKEKGCRITKQRQILLDVILKEECSCCKEIYYQATKLDNKIGIATVYRMVNMLEEIGAIDRSSMYKVDCKARNEGTNECRVEFDDDTICQLSSKEWSLVIEEGLKACGYMDTQEIKKIVIK
jgi:Fur family ferric uptake transcriptional regulator